MLAQTEAVHFPYTVSHRDVKHPRLEFRTGTLLVVLPYGQNEQRILEKHQRWINKKYQFIIDAKKTLKKIQFYSRSSMEFKRLVKELIDRFSQELQCNPDRLYVKKMVSKWASCSKKGNITVNRLLGSLPKNLIEYVIYHEMVHLKCRKHDSLFWICIGKKFENYKEMEQKLCTYWFAIQSQKM